MNTVKGARVKWTEVFEDPNLSMELLKARAINQHTNIGIDGIRSVCWKIYLSCIPSLELTTWPFAMNTERSKYSELRRKYIRAVSSGDDQEPDLEVNNPLSLAEDSPWQQFFVDSELKKIIKQDVDRTFPDNDYFRSEKVQEQLGDILFIYCKIHHDVSYRQGMHELAAYFYWVVANESLDVSAEGNLGTSDATFEVMKSVLDSNYIEHDTFALFSSLMSRAKPWYEFSDDGFGGARRPKPNNVAQTQLFGRPETPEPPPGKQTPVIEWSEKIFHYLERVDNELFSHLRSLEIQPQLFGIRWFRLLFGREFPLEDVLNLWDGIFAKDPSLNIVIFIGLALLLKIRDDLLDQDFSGCLHKLMRYPSVKDTHLFITQALKLQKLPNAAGGQEIIRQNNTLAGKPLPPLPSEQPSSPKQKIDHPSSSPHSSHHYSSHKQQPQHHGYSDHSRQIFPGNGVLSQHLPPAALDAIKPVAEGFVHVTKNVLESKGGAALNKAIHDMKKNTQSYIRKAGTAAPLPPSTTSNFPPMFDQAISSTGRLAASSRPAPSPPPTVGPKSHIVSNTDRNFQSQLGQVVAKALVILESELAPKATDSSKNASKEVLAAISGLEHVRDILLGFTRDLDPLVIESRMLDAPNPEQESKAQQESQNATKHDPEPTVARTLVNNGASPSPKRAGVASLVTGSPGPGSQRTDGQGSHKPDDRKILPRAHTNNGQEYRFDAGGEVYSGSVPSPSLVPVQAPPVKQSQPFSFDDLIDTSDSIPSRPNRAKDRTSGVSGVTANTKSPRSSIAHSQFSWILDEDNQGGSEGSTPGPGPTNNGPGLRPAAEIFSPSHSNSRMKLDPLAGSVSKRSTSFGRPPSAQGQHLHDDDPLRT
ncbi:TBC1 domain, member 5 [Podila verticillata]|nr:TBC1 domain, member 5 [Podila verticillata]KFH71770.1 hypothetical protein MVEG_02065 [Podila verticillata NRRL 6337]